MLPDERGHASWRLMLLLAVLPLLLLLTSSAAAGDTAPAAPPRTRLIDPGVQTQPSATPAPVVPWNGSAPAWSPSAPSVVPVDETPPTPAPVSVPTAAGGNWNWVWVATAALVGWEWKRRKVAVQVPMYTDIAHHDPVYRTVQHQDPVYRTVTTWVNQTRWVPQQVVTGYQTVWRQVQTGWNWAQRRVQTGWNWVTQPVLTGYQTVVNWMTRRWGHWGETYQVPVTTQTPVYQNVSQPQPVYSTFVDQVPAYQNVPQQVPVYGTQYVPQTVAVPQQTQALDHYNNWTEQVVDHYKDYTEHRLTGTKTVLQEQMVRVADQNVSWGGHWAPDAQLQQRITAEAQANPATAPVDQAAIAAKFRGWEQRYWHDLHRVNQEVLASDSAATDDLTAAGSSAIADGRRPADRGFLHRWMPVDRWFPHRRMPADPTAEAGARSDHLSRDNRLTRTLRHHMAKLSHLVADTRLGTAWSRFNQTFRGAEPQADPAIDPWVGVAVRADRWQRLTPPPLMPGTEQPPPPMALSAQLPSASPPTWTPSAPPQVVAADHNPDQPAPVTSPGVGGTWNWAWSYTSVPTGTRPETKTEVKDAPDIKAIPHSDPVTRKVPHHDPIWGNGWVPRVVNNWVDKQVQVGTKTVTTQVPDGTTTEYEDVWVTTYARKGRGPGIESGGYYKKVPHEVPKYKTVTTEVPVYETRRVNEPYTDYFPGRTIVGYHDWTEDVFDHFNNWTEYKQVGTKKVPVTETVQVPVKTVTWTGSWQFISVGLTADQQAYKDAATKWWADIANGNLSDAATVAATLPGLAAKLGSGGDDFIKTTNASLEAANKPAILSQLATLDTDYWQQVGGALEDVRRKTPNRSYASSGQPPMAAATTITQPTPAQPATSTPVQPQFTSSGTSDQSNDPGAQAQADAAKLQALLSALQQAGSGADWWSQLQTDLQTNLGSIDAQGQASSGSALKWLAQQIMVRKMQYLRTRELDGLDVATAWDQVNYEPLRALKAGGSMPSPIVNYFAPYFKAAADLQANVGRWETAKHDWWENLVNGSDTQGYDYHQQWDNWLGIELGTVPVQVRGSVSMLFQGLKDPMNAMLTSLTDKDKRWKVEPANLADVWARIKPNWMGAKTAEANATNDTVLEAARAKLAVWNAHVPNDVLALWEDQWKREHGSSGSFDFDPNWDAATKIAKLKPYLQQEQSSSGIPWEVSMAQFAIESSWGTQTPPGSYNLFGIKADDQWIASGKPWVPAKGTEGSSNLPEDMRWRKYNSYEESVKDHTDFLLKNGRYHPAFQYTDPYKFLAAIWVAGYATGPDYILNAGKVVYQADGWLDGVWTKDLLHQRVYSDPDLKARIIQRHKDLYRSLKPNYPAQVDVDGQMIDLTA